MVNAPLPDEFGHELCITAVEQTDAGVVFLVKAAQAEQLLAPLNEQGVLLLSKPFTTPLFLQAMHMAAAGNHRLQRLRQENARLQDKIGQLRLVSRAKCCLVEHAHMTEAEAHRYLEKQAMDTRRDRAEVAQEVLEEYADRSAGKEVRRERAFYGRVLFYNKGRYIFMAKFIFVTGGVVSGLGKGITAASLGRLLKCRGLKVASQKLDPYVNVDPGTMSPLQHGEVFVTDDGTETDLDLGHYERFIDENLNKYSNLTTGKVYWNVLNKERQGAYLGQTVQIIPHITNEIKSYIYNLASSTEADVVITEIGGTTGDIESQPFLEAIRQVGLEQGRENCCYIHVVLVPYISGSDEYKSKPAQHSVKELQGMGVSPDIIILRADGSVGSDIRRKISTFCNVKPECVIENLTMPSLYQCPLMLHTNGLDDVVVQQLHLDVPPADLTEWKQVVSRIATRSKTCTIALVGKYVKLHDAYLSVMESLYHAGFENDSQVEIRWVESEDLTDQAACKEAFADVDGIIVPGGFGDRGIEGMIQAAQYARENRVPCFGICLGMQIMVIEFARNVLGYKDANSSEFTPDGAHNVISLMPDQQGNIPKGGTMRLGKYPCTVAPGTKMAECYGESEIWERHRHRYEFNNDFRQEMQDAGLVISGTSPDGHLVETVELPGRDFHLGAQFHPEFKSRPNRAHPLFKGFIAAALRYRAAAQRDMLHL